jgi:phosphonate transport system substrate-binding protein
MGTRIRFLTFLAPNMYPVYHAVARFVGKRLGVTAELEVGECFEQIGSAQTDVAFICGLPYVQLRRLEPAPVELLAAPVLAGARYGGRPIYYSDVIARTGTPWRSFADLRGATWAYNDPDSHSGYGVTRHKLAQLGETRGFFGRVVQAGWHQRAIRMVLDGEVDASAIDSQVLAIELRDHDGLSQKLQVIDTLGPSSIQPVVIAAGAPPDLKREIQAALLAMSYDEDGRRGLAHGFVERFVTVSDGDYHDIRCMLETAEAAKFMTLR